PNYDPQKPPKNPPAPNPAATPKAPCPTPTCQVNWQLQARASPPFSRRATIADMSEQYVCPNCKTRIPFGTEDTPPPKRCPKCERRLWIPSNLSPDSIAELTCPICSTTFKTIVRFRDRPLKEAPCPTCGFPTHVNPADYPRELPPDSS